VDLPLGHPSRPMSAADFDAKAADCLRHAARPLPGDALARLRAAVDGLDATEDAGALARVLRPDG
jgi:hypothetical protein